MKPSQMLKKDRQIIISILFAVALMPLLFGYIWSSIYIQHVPFGIVDMDNSALSRSVTAQLESSPSLDACYFTESQDDLQMAIADGKIAAGIIIPENFSNDMLQKRSPKAMIFANGGNLSLSGPAVSAASSVLSTISAGTQIKMLEGNGLNPSTASTSLGTFSFAERVLYDPINGYLTKLIYTIIITIILSTFIPRYFLPLMMEKRNELIQCTSRKEILANIGEIVGRVSIVSVGAIVASFISLFLLAIFRGLPLRGDLILYFVSMAAVMLNFIGFGMILVLMVKKAENLRFLHQIFIMTSSVHVFLSGVAYPFYLMPKPLVVLSKMFLPLAHLSTQLKALNLKGIGWDVALPDLAISLLYSIFWLTIGITGYAISIQKERRKICKATTYNQSE